MTLAKRQKLFEGIGMSYVNNILRSGLEQSGSTR